MNINDKIRQYNEFCANFTKDNVKSVWDEEELLVQEFVNWIRSADVIRHKQDNKTLIVASNNCDTLFFFTTLENNHLSKRIVWLSDGQSIVLSHDLVGHSTGLFWGERIESIWSALIQRIKVFDSIRE